MHYDPNPNLAATKEELDEIRNFILAVIFAVLTCRMNYRRLQTSFKMVVDRFFKLPVGYLSWMPLKMPSNDRNP